MRSLLIATALCAVASLTGCSFTISGPCTTLSHQSRLNGDCGGCAEGVCDSCAPGAMMSSCGQGVECPPTDFGQGLPNGFESCGDRPSLGNVGCSNGLLGRLMARRTGVGGCDDGSCEMVEAGTCDDGSCGSGGLLGRTGLGDRARAHVASLGCGQMGCGRDGQPCLGCRSRAGSLLGPTRGPIPRVEAPMGPGAGVAPSYVYPYYTTRGPRDFLLANPPSIGY